MTTIEQKIKQTFGELQFELLIKLQHIEELENEIQRLKNEDKTDVDGQD